MQKSFLHTCLYYFEYKRNILIKKYIYYTITDMTDFMYQFQSETTRCSGLDPAYHIKKSDLIKKLDSILSFIRIYSAAPT